VKPLHRTILLSATYQQRSDDRPECIKADSENRLLWKVTRHRLDFEATRDALLAVAGRLEAKVGGSSVKDILAPASTRRTMYGFVDRLQVPGLYRAFDFPSPDATSPAARRDHDPAAGAVPDEWPVRRGVRPGAAPPARRRGDNGRAGRAGWLYRICFGREPTAAELELAQTVCRRRSGSGVGALHPGAAGNERFVFVD